jgi:hypothetical protein
MTAFWCSARLRSQALFFDVMAVKADQRCSTSLLPQCGQRTLLPRVDEGQHFREVFLAIVAEKFVAGHTTSGKEWLGKF